MSDKKMNKPYKEEIIDNRYLRFFSENVPEEELVWHRDREDRIVEPIEPTDWMFQTENKLPVKIEGQLFIPKGSWHRVIKGTGSLKIKINKL